MNVNALKQALENGIWDSTLSAFKGPEGLVFGFGTTVGNGIQGWAPGALFIDTDAAAGSQMMTNEGTKTTASWSRIEAGSIALASGETLTAVSGSSIQCESGSYIGLGDVTSIRFGADSDRYFMWQAADYLSCGPVTGLWKNAPSPADPDPYMAIVVHDDFVQGNDPDTPLPFWKEIDDAGTGTNAYTTATIGGSVNIVTAAADNDYHALATPTCPFSLLSAKPLWFEARFRLAEATTNESSWWFGLTSSLTTGGMQANTAGPLAEYDGVLMWKPEAAMGILSETSNATTQATNTTLGTFVTNTWTRVGFYVSGAATTGVVTFYSDLDGTGPLTAFTTTKTITRAGMVPMYVVMGVKAGPTAAAETLEVDYVKCVQVR